MESQCTLLPPEVICHILCFASPRDVVRLRTVSKQFYDLTYDLETWRTLYTNARLPRPPGPFPSQSIQFLERTLVRSERLTYWATMLMEDVSSVVIWHEWKMLFCGSILYSKWLVGCESFTKFVLYDLDSNAGPCPNQLLWEFASRIESWDVAPVVSTSGPLIYIASTDYEPDVPWKLMEFRIDGDSLCHTFTLDAPTEATSAVRLSGGHSPFLHLQSQDLFFDSETKSFYTFPIFQSALVSTTYIDDETLSRSATLLTKTHIISLFHHTDYTASPIVSTTLIQVFTIPTDPGPIHNTAGVLHLSHEAVTLGHIERVDLIRNSIVDAVSGATNIRLLHELFVDDDLHFSCIDLTLPKSSSADSVVPITIDIHDIVLASVGLSDPDTEHLRYIESSDDGHARGFLRFTLPYDLDEDLPAYSPAVVQFTIDASRDRCVAVLGETHAPRWTTLNGDSVWRSRFTFDGVRGCLYNDKVRRRTLDGDDAAVVVNLK